MEEGVLFQGEVTFPQLCYYWNYRTDRQKWFKRSSQSIIAVSCFLASVLRYKTSHMPERERTKFAISEPIDFVAFVF
jgi:hypothetical protein|tara:strand:- start:30089 stop:30319 length:231 start_codon:yes stop_codon:yes gene_type:complete